MWGGRGGGGPSISRLGSRVRRCDVRVVHTWHTGIPEEVGRGYDDIQMSHDKYRLHDDVIAYFTFRA